LKFGPLDPEIEERVHSADADRLGVGRAHLECRGGFLNRPSPQLLPEIEKGGLDQAHHSRRDLDPAEKLPEDLFEALGLCLDGATLFVPAAVVAIAPPSYRGSGMR